MSKAEAPLPTDEFGFTKNEKRFERVTHERLLYFMEREDTTIHEVKLSTNTYGEFLFVSVTRQGDPFPGYVSFWGMGYHEQRERWLTDEWFWFRSAALTSLLERALPHDEALNLIDERQADVKHWAAQAKPQSARGKLFETLADLTDEDGAYTELEDWSGDFPEDIDDD